MTDAMLRRRLGKSELDVGELALGTWTFGRETPQETAFALLDRFVEHGGNLLETADSYNRGRSEEILGAWVAARRNRADVLLATKAFFPTGPGPGDVGLSRRHLLAAVDASLRRLRTDHVDLYQVHCHDAGVPLEETLAALDELVRAGKARYVGASNFLGWQLVQAVLTSRQNGWAELVSVQNEYNLLSRGNELEVLPACAELGVALVPWSPLAGGWLTGKHRRGIAAPLAGTRVAETAQPWQPDSWASRANERTWSVVDALLEVAAARGVAPAEVALNWVRTRPQVRAPLLGARTLEQLESNLRCLSWSLTPEEVAALDAASAPDMPYPYSFVAHVNAMLGRSPVQETPRRSGVRRVLGSLGRRGRIV